MNKVYYCDYEYSVIPGDCKLYKGVCYGWNDVEHEDDDFDNAWYGIQDMIKARLTWSQYISPNTLTPRPLTPLEMNNTLNTLERENFQLKKDNERIQELEEELEKYKSFVSQIKGVLSFVFSN